MFGWPGFERANVEVAWMVQKGPFYDDYYLHRPGLGKVTIGKNRRD